MTREDIEVTVENNTLDAEGRRRSSPAEVKEEQFRRIERHYGTFIRSFTLPNTVDATKVGRRVQERRADGEAAVPRRGEAAHDQRRSRGVSRAGLRLDRRDPERNGLAIGRTRPGRRDGSEDPPLHVC